jgi:glucokinase
VTNTEAPSPHVPTTRIVYGMDAGGTKLSLLVSMDGMVISLPSDFGSMQDAIRWISEKFGLPDLLLIGGAGAPDAYGNIELTNRDWPVFNPAQFGEEVGCKIIVVNDMVIKAAGLAAANVEVLHAGVESNATKTVVTVSTGVGNAQLLPDGKIVSSEGGHTTWQSSPGGLEDAVLKSLRQLFPGQRYFSVEELIAGSHFYRLYCALKATKARLRSGRDEYRVETALKNGVGIGPLLTDMVLREEPDPFCQLFMEVVGSLLGQYLRNLALFALADGGIYLTGGVMQPAVARYLFEKTSLLEAFRGGSQHNERLANIPIYLVTDQDLGVKGAYQLALQY